MWEYPGVLLWSIRLPRTSDGVSFALLKRIEAGMSLSRVNFFVPYESAPAWHENQLTRALLVVLRYCPMAHQAWLRLVEPARQLHELARAEFATQRTTILGPQAVVGEGEEIPGISVWLAPDAATVDSQVKASDRQQVLDGIVTYSNDLVIVIENKVKWGGVTEQPHRINLHGSPVRFDTNPRAVKWQDLLAVLFDLVEHDLVSGAERMLLSDFFDFVEQHFPRIGPYSSLARCGDERFRLERRLDSIQGEAVGTDIGKERGWRDITGTPKIFMAGLSLSEDGSRASLRMHPADTLGQARAFYGDPPAVNAVLALRTDGWRIEPNFHWGFMATGYVWLFTPLPVESYCDYWIREISATGELARGEWDSYWTALESGQIVEATGKDAFDAEFTRSKRNKAQPRPGLACEFSWELPKAKERDGHGKFVEDVRGRINQMLTALNAPAVTGHDTGPSQVMAP